MYGWRARIGLIVPSSNTTMEPEFWKMAPEGVSIHTARVPLSLVNEEELIRMEKFIEDAALLLKDAYADIIVYGCTSGSLIKGQGYDKSLAMKINKVTNIKAITTSTAVVEALKALNVEKVAVATPYIQEVNEKEKEFLESEGFKVIRIKGLGVLRNYDIGRLSPWDAYRLGREVYTREADALFISCTNFRTIEIINVLEHDIGAPVVTSNQATMWFALRELGIKEKGQYGKLFSLL